MTREEAIQRLKANRDAMYFPETIEALDMAIKALQTEAEWIPCSERLPENDGCVLVSVDYGIGIEFGKYENGVWSIWDCEHWDKWGSKGTIAWMPLPNPYREDGE